MGHCRSYHSVLNVTQVTQVTSSFSSCCKLLLHEVCVPVVYKLYMPILAPWPHFNKTSLVSDGLGLNFPVAESTRAEYLMRDDAERGLEISCKVFIFGTCVSRCKHPDMRKSKVKQWKGIRLDNEMASVWLEVNFTRALIYWRVSK